MSFDVTKLERVGILFSCISSSRHVILKGLYGPGLFCGQSVLRVACAHVETHKSNQGAPAEHP